ncbi:MAG: hypothetical protein U9O86_05570 [Campylobacterota bacterium]|nr:hypothetical protein [Campylobacterota bacterium]
MKLLFLSLLSFYTVFAADILHENDFSVRGFWGASSASDFDQLYTFKGLNTSPYKTNVYGVDTGYKLFENIFDLPFDIYAKAGVSYFDENYHQGDFLEAVVCFKLVYKLNVLDNQFRIGFAEGGSYAGRVPWVEAKEAEAEDDNQAKFLNYLEFSFDFDIGKLIRVKSMENYYIGYLIKHRSGFHGTYGGVYDGGSNYNCIYLEKNF